MEEQNYNVILDDLPEEWNGYRICSDFRVGIQLVQMLEDTEYSQIERLAYAAELLFDDMPDTGKISTGLWILETIIIK